MAGAPPCWGGAIVTITKSQSGFGRSVISWMCWRHLGGRKLALWHAAARTTARAARPYRRNQAARPARSRLANRKGRHRDKLFVGRCPVTPHEDGQPCGLIEHSQSMVPCIWPVSEALPSRSEKGLGSLDVWSALCRVRRDHYQYAAGLKWQKGLRRELMSLKQISF
jgi:hypothetical protein